MTLYIELLTICENKENYDAGRLLLASLNKLTKEKNELHAKIN